jgi:hypothetical protein
MPISAETRQILIEVVKTVNTNFFLFARLMSTASNQWFFLRPHLGLVRFIGVFQRSHILFRHLRRLRTCLGNARECIQMRSADESRVCWRSQVFLIHSCGQQRRLLAELLDESVGSPTPDVAGDNLPEEMPNGNRTVISIPTDYPLKIYVEEVRNQSKSETGQQEIRRLALKAAKLENRCIFICVLSYRHWRHVYS